VKVLVVTPYPVSPSTHGARVRVKQLAVALKRAGATVDVLFPWRPGVPLRHFDRDGVGWHPQRFLANALPFVLGDRVVPPLVALSQQPFRFGPRRRFRAFAGYDIVQFELCAYPSWMGLAVPGARVVYSAHNVEQDLFRGQPASPFRESMLGRLADLERGCVSQSDLVVACTDADADRLKELYGGTSFAVVPNGFDDTLLYFDRHSSRDAAREALGVTKDELVLLFVGGPGRHNREAADLLEHRLLPELGSDVTLVLAGQCARGREASSNARGRVRRMGFVPDLRSLFAAADIAVNPVTRGSGSNLKLAEYLAAGLPVVTTPIGLRGYETFADRVEVAPLEDFPRHIISLKLDAAKRPGGLGDFSWSALGSRLHDAYADLLEK
jgi:glycosyltransferase involved in cell wall biosynthesis